MFLANKCVLVVEDDYLISGLLEDMLGDLGCTHVVVRPSVEAAVDALTSESPDVVILDLNLNGRSSLPVAEILRQRKIRFAFASGYDAAALPPEWRAEVVIQKPFTQNELKQKILQALA